MSRVAPRIATRHRVEADPRADDRPRLVHVFHTFTVGGGAQVRTAQTIDATADRFRHVVVSLDGRTDGGASLDPDADVDLVPFPGSVSGGNGVRGLRRLLSRLRPDLLLTYNWGAIEAIVAARSLGVRRILHHEDGFNDDESDGQLLRRVLTRRPVLRLATRVVVPSRTLRRLARRSWWLPEERLVHIPNGIDPDRFSPAPAGAVRDRLGLEPSDFVVGTVSNLGANKNVELLLKAFARLRAGGGRQAGKGPVRLLVVGGGPRLPALRETAEELGVADAVVFAGRVPDPVDHYRAMDLFALTSRTEQMPLSVLEAMAVGLPVVSTDVGDVGSMLGAEGRSHLVPAGDLEALVTALEALWREPEERHRVGRHHRRRCRREFDARRVTERYARLYADLLRGRTPRGRSSWSPMKSRAR